MSDDEFPPWELLRRPARRVIEPPPIPDRMGLAYHEAGHAVVMRAFSQRIWRAEMLAHSGRVRQIVDIAPGDDGAGGAFSPEELATLDDAVAIGHAAIAAAGLQAELLRSNRHGQPGGRLRLRRVIVTREDADARLMAMQLAVRFEAPVGVHYCQAVARAVLCRHWTGVQAIARHLYRCGRVGGATVDSLLAAAGCTAGIGIDWTLDVVGQRAADTARAS